MKDAWDDLKSGATVLCQGLRSSAGASRNKPKTFSSLKDPGTSVGAKRRSEPTLGGIWLATTIELGNAYAKLGMSRCVMPMWRPSV